jgi:hypothetical protein
VVGTSFVFGVGSGGAQGSSAGWLERGGDGWLLPRSSLPVEDQALLVVVLPLLGCSLNPPKFLICKFTRYKTRRTWLELLLVASYSTSTSSTSEF